MRLTLFDSEGDSGDDDDDDDDGPFCPCFTRTHKSKAPLPSTTIRGVKRMTHLLLGFCDFGGNSIRQPTAFFFWAQDTTTRFFEGTSDETMKVHAVRCMREHRIVVMTPLSCHTPFSRGSPLGYDTSQGCVESVQPDLLYYCRMPITLGECLFLNGPEDSHCDPPELARHHERVVLGQRELRFQ